MMGRSSTLGCCFAVGLVAAVVASPSGVAQARTAGHPALAAPKTAVHGDFDGDGKSDLVAIEGGTGDARVQYTRAHPGGHHVEVLVPPFADAGHFSAVAVGDFNADGFADLVLGAPGFSHNEDGTEQGAVYIYYGSKTGLLGLPTVFTGPNNFDDDNELGSAVATGDINGDGYDDLAAGNPGPAGGGDSEGSVTIFFGSPSGLTSSGREGFGSSHVVDEAQFGAAVTLADVNGDGFADVVVGEPGGHPGTSIFVNHPQGDVQVFFGTKHGVGAKHRLIWGKSVKAADGFGSVLAAGNIDGHAPADVVASAPLAAVDGHPGAGKIVVFRGGASGLTPARHQTLGARFTHLPKSSQGHARFGDALAVGDVTGDGKSDVIVGAPPAQAPHANFGAVYVLHGSAHGVTATGAQRLTQASVGNPGSTPRASHFGTALAILITGHGPRREVAIGLPGANLGGKNNRKGAVLLLHGAAKGLSTQHVRLAAGASAHDQLGVALGP